jgi:glucosamine--fructose-6-phosphate aminotransferase (isomerizing)
VVVAFSRSGETTELLRAVQKSKLDGRETIGITCFSDSTLSRLADRVISTTTHPEEGIVMTASASLMLVMAMRYAGYSVGPEVSQAARDLLNRFCDKDLPELSSRSHFVFLGGGALCGIAAEGGLKLQEMSCSFTQSYHPLEYRHGPVSLADQRTAVVFLYHPDTRDEEEQLADELRAKGAFVVGFGGKGDLSFEVDVAPDALGLVYLPSLQMLGERVAELRGLDTASPRHLTKVVVLP